LFRLNGHGRQANRIAQENVRLSTVRTNARLSVCISLLWRARANLNSTKIRSHAIESLLNCTLLLSIHGAGAMNGKQKYLARTTGYFVELNHEPALWHSCPRLLSLDGLSRFTPMVWLNGSHSSFF